MPNNRKTIAIVLTVNGLLFPFKDDKTPYKNEHFMWNGDPEGWVEFCQNLKTYADKNEFDIDFYVLTVEDSLDRRNALAAQMLQKFVCCASPNLKDFHYIRYAPATNEKEKVFFANMYACPYDYGNIIATSHFPMEIKGSLDPNYYVVGAKYGKSDGITVGLKAIQKRSLNNTIVYLVDHDQKIADRLRENGWGLMLVDRYDIKDVGNREHTGCSLTNSLEISFTTVIGALLSQCKSNSDAETPNPTPRP